jgi:formylglycine-generating enzyme required for sulfatase activity
VTKLKENYLSLSGYRLPTEAEMEYATRSGARSSRYYGETDDLLEKYAWYAKNSNELVQRVGRKKPNDIGLFDVQGNCFTWCQEPFAGYPEVEGEEAVEDKEGQLVVISTATRVLRGGSFGSRSAIVRSALRNDSVPTTRDVSYGFRPSRTLPLGSFTALPPPPKGGRK